MPRVTNGPASRKRRNKILKQAKGYFASKSKLPRYAREALDHALQYAYDDRKKKRSNARALWIVRLNAACREAGITYSRFMEGLKAASIQIDRRQLSEIAIADATAFAALVKQAQAALKAKAAKA